MPGQSRLYNEVVQCAPHNIGYSRPSTVDQSLMFNMCFSFLFRTHQPSTGNHDLSKSDDQNMTFSYTSECENFVIS